MVSSGNDSFDTLSSGVSVFIKANCITARIINFIKGIRVDKKEMGIDEALAGAEDLGKREIIGIEILRRLFKERVKLLINKDHFLFV
jgi:hypothetical protein